MNLTETEECWIKERFGRIQEQFVSVVPGEDYMRELIDLLGHGKPVSKRFPPQFWLIMTERVRRVLKIHPEFNNLPDYEQQVFWRKNYKYAAAVAVTRINSLQTGYIAINTFTIAILNSGSS